MHTYSNHEDESTPQLVQDIRKNGEQKPVCVRYSYAEPMNAFQPAPSSCTKGVVYTQLEQQPLPSNYLIPTSSTSETYSFSKYTRRIGYILHRYMISSGSETSSSASYFAKDLPDASELSTVSALPFKKTSNQPPKLRTMQKFKLILKNMSCYGYCLVITAFIVTCLLIGALTILLFCEDTPY